MMSKREPSPDTAAQDWPWLTTKEVARRSGLPEPIVPALVAGVLSDDGQHRYDDLGLMRAQLASAMLTIGVTWGLVCKVMKDAHGYDEKQLRNERDQWQKYITQRRRQDRARRGARWLILLILLATVTGVVVIACAP